MTAWPALQNRWHDRLPHLASQVLTLNGSIDILGGAAGAGVGGRIVSTSRSRPWCGQEVRSRLRPFCFSYSAKGVIK
ncbi:hypothetical protein EPA93_07880 [Ktedonosporobacter rubrisoli]|uniref:Uncharacterized protein n=1 Tax=Ktedonosporobacter rubrisoli TaxID=2509675 RepID=A0A4V0YYE4_KTERU|nr:hypothetical protein [Ktedonosporobacter rubrisoli]QBD75931.1 hypothetical protein EPA93_07880 [Ktedonosporobacter rubrisoli]